MAQRYAPSRIQPDTACVRSTMGKRCGHGFDRCLHFGGTLLVRAEEPRYSAHTGSLADPSSTLSAVLMEIVRIDRVAIAFGRGSARR